MNRIEAFSCSTPRECRVTELYDLTELDDDEDWANSFGLAGADVMMIKCVNLASIPEGEPEFFEGAGPIANVIPTFPMDATDNDGQWTLEPGLAGAEGNPEDWVLVPEVAQVLAVQAQSEIVIDSGADISVAPFRLAGLGASTRRSGVMMQDAQGNRITIREKFCIAPIENVILSLGGC